MQINRQAFLRSSAGSLWLSAMMSLGRSQERSENPQAAANGGIHHQAKAKRIIYLFQSGAPSQMDLFDPKPALDNRRGEDLPESIRQGQRLTTMTSGQSKFQLRFENASGTRGLRVKTTSPGHSGKARRNVFKG
jgi:hypothetical protein